MIQVATYKGAFKDKFGVPRQSGVVPQLLGRIVFEKEWCTPDSIRGLEGFDYLWILWGFSENRHQSHGVTVRPPRLGGNEHLGVFATRSPYRPNPIGLSSVRIDHIEGSVIYVRGADLVDGTPIYDIKPYVPYTDSHPDARAGFTDCVEWKPLKVEFDVKCPLDLDLEELRCVLEQDPRPRYHDDEERVYGMRYGDYDVLFRVKGAILSVVEIKKV